MRYATSLSSTQEQRSQFDQLGPFVEEVACGNMTIPRAQELFREKKIHLQTLQEQLGFVRSACSKLFRRHIVEVRGGLSFDSSLSGLLDDIYTERESSIITAKREYVRKTLSQFLRLLLECRFLIPETIPIHGQEHEIEVRVGSREDVKALKEYFEVFVRKMEREIESAFRILNVLEFQTD